MSRVRFVLMTWLASAALAIAVESAPAKTPAPTSKQGSHSEPAQVANPSTNSAPKVDAVIGKYLSDNRANPAAKSLSTAASSPPPAELEGLENPSLRPPATSKSDRSDWKRRDYEQQLDVARQLRQKKDFPQAVINLVTLLESDASEDVKRPALLELGLAAQQAGQLLRAQQVFAQFVGRYPDDPQVPEVLLRQGLIHRELGAHTLALAKFYAVLSSSLTLKLDRFPFYQRLVLQAQIEIADTFFLQGKYSEAAEYLARLLRLETSELDKPRIQFKLIRAQHSQGRHDEAIGQGNDFLKRNGDSTDVPELRFLLARSYMTLGRVRESLREVMLLMESQLATGQTNAMALAYWQQRAGNDIANQLYQEGDLLGALQVYQGLAQIDRSPQWQLPAWYQIGLIYERLKQPARAIESFDHILQRGTELDAAATPAVKTVLEMARWRKDFLQWQTRAEAAVPVPPPPPITNEPPKAAKSTVLRLKK
ncbi:MAG: tetratricopeptide repeat protein [Verrucomicrobia bacterium]|nr:tetratricopeptide repeat protein [Verrucomicrobiota bacterium]